MRNNDFAVDFLFVFRSGCQGMGKPFLPMISGVLEMIMRVLVIALFIGKIGFTAAAYAEIAAWCFEDLRLTYWR